MTDMDGAIVKTSSDGKNAIFHPLMKVACRMTALLGLFFSPGLLLSVLAVLFAAAAAGALLRA